MSQLQTHADLEVVDRGPDWLFVRIHLDPHHLDQVANRLWELLNQHLVHRLVLEMNEVDILPSQLIGQLVILHKRVLQHEGALRLCGLSAECQQALRFCRLDHAFPNYETREDAVNACAVHKPR